MLIRVISSVVALPLLFFFVIKGGIYLEIAAGLISLIAVHEFMGALKKKFKPFELPTYLLLIGFYISYHQTNFTLLSGLIAIYIAALLILFVTDRERSIADVGVTIIASSYIIFFMYHVVLLSNLQPTFLIWYIFIVSWGADTGAYFVGNKFGKRKLAPTVSPKKSVEGAIGGVITAVLMSVLLAVFFDKSFIIYSIFIGIVGSIISVMGDLVASKIKREMSVKDFGNIMPGHGGIMDRFDSLLLVTPFVYYCIQLVLWIK